MKRRQRKYITKNSGNREWVESTLFMGDPASGQILQMNNEEQQILKECSNRLKMLLL